MTVFLLFLGFIALLGSVLVMADEWNKRGWARNRTLTNENTALHALVNEVANEARIQLDAGVPAFGYTAQLIDESGFLTPPTQKELPR